MRFILFIILILAGYFSFGQVQINGELSGFGETKSCEVFVPFGPFHNSVLPNTVSIKPDSTFHLELNIKTNAIVEIRIATHLVSLYIEPGDKIDFKIQNVNDKNKSLQIKGPNSAGSYWYNLYNYIPAQNFPKQEFLSEEIKNKTPEEVLREIRLFLNKETKPLDSLKRAGLVTDSFVEIAKNDVYALHMRHLGTTLNQISSPKDPALPKKVKELEKLIYQTYPPIDPINISTKFGAAYAESGYLEMLAADNQSVGKRDSNNNFGVYNSYFRLPLIFQEYLFGRALLLQKVLSVEEFNFEKGYNSFKTKFPESPYIPFIDRLLKMELVNYADTSIHFDTVAQFKSFKDLLAQYKGRRLLIDLWATWCVPCKMEFPNYKSIYADLATHDITPLFISIDDPLLKNLWKKTALQYGLKGYHMIANKALQADLKNLIYEKEPLSIPRYILVDEKGKIIDANAPRPSDAGLLTKELNERFK